MKRTVKYIGFFDFQDSLVTRKYELACTNKMESIAEALIDAGYNVEIISSAVGTNDRFFFAKGEIIKKSDNLQARFFPTFGGPNVLIRAFRRIITDILLTLFLLFKTHKGEPIIVYHSIAFRNIILLTKKIKKFKLILELEEVYQDVVVMSEKDKRREVKTFNVADGYIFPTELLNKAININNKPYALILGTYHVEPEIQKAFNDGRIHVVYAGTFDPRKGGAAAAAAAAELPDNYCFHICGFGSPQEEKAIIDQVNEVNRKAPGKAVYHGTLTGNNYISLLQSCHIGLSTQNPNAAFNATSFPSKILSYMANGLDVVTIDIPAIKDSAIGSKMHFYQRQDSKEIAHAITSVEIGKHDNRRLIQELYTDFVKQIKVLISRFER